MGALGEVREASRSVANTPGAEPPARVTLPASTQVISKATTPEKDAYSGFQDTQLALRLRERGCARIFMGGLATEYCVRATALEGLRAGRGVVVLEDAIHPLELHTGDGARALAEMVAQGARVTRLRDLIA